MISCGNSEPAWDDPVSISGFFLALWKELGKSSVLSQQFLDDIYLNEDANYLNNGRNDIEHCVKYLKPYV